MYAYGDANELDEEADNAAGEDEELMSFEIDSNRVLCVSDN